MDIHKAPSHKGKSRIGRAVKFFKKNKHSIKNSRTLAHLRDRITKWRGGPRGKAHKGTGVSHYRVLIWKKHQQSHTHRVAKITAQSFN